MHNKYISFESDNKNGIHFPKVRTYSQLLLLIRAIAREQFGFDEIETVTVDADMRKDLEIDSLDIVEFLMTMEAEFNVNISQDDATGIRTLRNIADVIADQMDFPKVES
uniref:acyl carrier protein n=1 Tax=Haramonas pauciplastida TaxID=478668 RepID=UPI0021138FE9|nr:acyl carrier protein [Haramonas pauciplastida]UTE94946.1 acyl carrier protein [Haramonas pauciplastida]